MKNRPTAIDFVSKLSFMFTSHNNFMVIIFWMYLYQYFVVIKNTAAEPSIFLGCRFILEYIKFLTFRVACLPKEINHFRTSPLIQDPNPLILPDPAPR